MSTTGSSTTDPVLARARGRAPLHMCRRSRPAASDRSASGRPAIGYDTARTRPFPPRRAWGHLGGSRPARHEVTFEAGPQSRAASIPDERRDPRAQARVALEDPDPSRSGGRKDREEHGWLHWARYLPMMRRPVARVRRRARASTPRPVPPGNRWDGHVAEEVHVVRPARLPPDRGELRAHCVGAERGAGERAQARTPTAEDDPWTTI